MTSMDSSVKLSLRRAHSPFAVTIPRVSWHTTRVHTTPANLSSRLCGIVLVHFLFGSTERILWSASCVEEDFFHFLSLFIMSSCSRTFPPPFCWLFFNSRILVVSTKFSSNWWGLDTPKRTARWLELCKRRPATFRLWSTCQHICWSIHCSTLELELFTKLIGPPCSCWESIKWVPLCSWWHINDWAEQVIRPTVPSTGTIV